MSKIYANILISLFLLQSTTSANNSYIPITITKIYDGDTVEAKIDNEVFSIRLKGIDCYETSKLIKHTSRLMKIVLF